MRGERRFLGIVTLAAACAIAPACGGSSEKHAAPGPVCEAGDLRNCLCDDDEVGRQVCADDGSEWGSCRCGDDSTGGSTGSAGSGEPSDAGGTVGSGGGETESGGANGSLGGRSSVGGTGQGTGGTTGVAGQPGTGAATGFGGEVGAGGQSSVAGAAGTSGAGGEATTAGAAGSGGSILDDCPLGQVLCGSTCVDLDTDSSHCGACDASCSVNATCSGAVCVCRHGFQNCDGECVNLLSDASNCGSCGTVCSTDNVCSSGTCSDSCGSGEAQCGKDCVNLLSDALNCGSCDNICTGGRICQQGSCICDDEQAFCGTSCVDTSSNTSHCGGCNVACVGEESCLSGTCACAGGLDSCSGTCVELSSDNSNCGVCGRTCGLLEQCTSGVCECQQGLSRCTDGCVDLTSDPGNCGSCGNTCETEEVCSLGQCLPECDSGLTKCGESCVNLQTNSSHCGSCTHQCEAGLVCVDGVCDCPDELTLCGTQCVNTESSLVHCGGCDHFCMSTHASDTACVEGVCEPVCITPYVDCETPASPDADNGCEANSNTNVDHCGECGRDCNDTNVQTLSCADGQCTSTCDSGHLNCTQPAAPTGDDGCETPFSTADCGSCERACSESNVSTASCNGNGECDSACDSGYLNCSQPSASTADDGCETPFSTDDCGGCGRACGSDHVSTLSCNGAGLCTATCDTGYLNAVLPQAPSTDDGCETIDPNTNVEHCGALGRPCASTNVDDLSCTGGLCTSTCDASYGNCTQPEAPSADDGCEADLQVDPDNCGECHNDCSSSSCRDGQCCDAAHPSCCAVANCSGASCCDAILVPGGAFPMGRSDAEDTCAALLGDTPEDAGTESSEPTEGAPCGPSIDPFVYIGVGGTCLAGDSVWGCVGGYWQQFGAPDGTSSQDLTEHVALVSDFYLDKFEVTVGRFRAFVEAGRGTRANPPAAGTGGHPLIGASGWDASWNNSLASSRSVLLANLKCDSSYQTWTDTAGANEQYPMNCVSWYEAFAFCIWDGGRLPTEAEWEYVAAHGSENRIYPWGNELPDPVPANCSYNHSTPFLAVGSEPTGNGYWGQTDLAGGIWEWVLDTFAAYPTVCDNCASLDGGTNRVKRSSDFENASIDLRCTARYGRSPSSREYDLGIRCARNAP